MRELTIHEKLLWLYARRGGGGHSWLWQLVTGTAPLALLDAVAHPIHSLTQYGKCTQDGTPTPAAPVDIVCNNGAIKVRRPSGMPIAYQMVEWLKSTGSIAITGFKTKSTQEIETVFYRESRGLTYLYASDTATSGTTNTTAYLTTAGGNWRWDGKVATITPTTGIKITSIQNNDGVWLNGTKAGWYSDAGEFVSTNDLRLSSGENTTVRIYSMTIREGETVTLDLVPVQRVTDNAYGFYDKVSGNFYTNAEATFEAGDPIPDPVEIYTDGTPETLTVYGQNLVDVAHLTPVNLAYSPNRLVTNANRYGYYIPVKPNTKYTISISREKTNAYLNICETTSEPANNVVVQSYANMDGTNASETITTKGVTNWLYVYAGYMSSGFDPFTEGDFQIEEGQTATPFAPYHRETVTVPMLLGVDDYKDEAELISGIKTGKVGVKVFDGTEDWTAFTSSTLVIQNATSAWGAVAGVGGYCTHLTVLKAGETTFAGACRFATAFNVYEYKTAFGVADVAGFKAFLAEQYAAGTPVIVLYPLATETTEQTTAHALHTSAGTNTVDVSAAVEGVTLEVEYAMKNAS